jgi:hypothetical protein
LHVATVDPLLLATSVSLWAGRINQLNLKDSGLTAHRAVSPLPLRGLAAPKSSPTALAYGTNAFQSGAGGGGIWLLTLTVHLPSAMSAHR